MQVPSVGVVVEFLVLRAVGRGMEGVGSESRVEGEHWGRAEVFPMPGSPLPALAVALKARNCFECSRHRNAAGPQALWGWGAFQCHS